LWFHFDGLGTVDSLQTDAKACARSFSIAAGFSPIKQNCAGSNVVQDTPNIRLRLGCTRLGSLYAQPLLRLVCNSSDSVSPARPRPARHRDSPRAPSRSPAPRRYRGADRRGTLENPSRPARTRPSIRRTAAGRRGGGTEPIERQTRIIGATWLDQQLINGGKGLGDLGFGAEVRHTMQLRADFLTEQGLAEKRGQRIILARNLLATLRNKELAQAAKNITDETGLQHRPVINGQRVTGTYRRNILLASGRYAILDDGLGFSLVPWKPVIEQQLGKQLAATVKGRNVSWEIGRQRGLVIH